MGSRKLQGRRGLAKVVVRRSEALLVLEALQALEILWLLELWELALLELEGVSLRGTDDT